MHKLPVKETVRAYFGGLQVPIIVDIDADIVDVIVAQMLFDEEASKTTVTNALKAFELKESTDDNGSLKMWYSVMLKNSLQFYCIVDYLSVGCSFRQSAEIDMATRERTRIASMGSLNQGTIAKYARVCCAMNYMELKMLLSEDCWTFSVALDMSNHQATGYLDIRVRVYTKGKIQNYHVVSLPINGAHTAANMFETFEKFFDVLCPSWRNKVLSCASDGEAKMTG